ncbi:MAG: nucleotidyltransferase family protein [Oscillospiraceae bacterium]|nr:nucleotidyltransferase family protein [Oscillospiraceae bacterium]
MKIAAIIAEYNPFHDGHRYHIEQTKLLTGATHVIAVMSGNFTQRGDVAIVPKHGRVRTALQNGIDLVIELPVAFSLSSAEQFATGAVTILDALGCVETLSFGSECGDVELLKEAAGAVHYAQTTDEFFNAMKNGKSYPAALQSAVETYYTDDVVEVLTGANNTLAVEYIKALNESGSKIEPFTLKRIGAGHDEHIETSQEEYICASQIRKSMLENDSDGEYADIMRLETAILAKLRTLSAKEIKKAPNVGGGLENRIFSAARAARSLSELYFLAKTKRYTLARIRRAILCCFLGIAQVDVKLKPQYVRILGLNGKGKEILALLRENPSSLPIDTSLATLAKKSDECKRQAVLEDRCTNIYGLAFRKNLVCGKEFTEKVVVSE